MITQVEFDRTQPRNKWSGEFVGSMPVARVARGPWKAEQPPPSLGRRASARRTSASSQARPTGPTTSCCPACCTWLSSAVRSRTRGSPRVDVSAARSEPGVIAALLRRRLRRRAGQPAVRMAGHAGRRHPGAPADGGRRGPLRRRGGGRSWSPATGTRPPTRSPPWTIDYDPLPPVLDIGPALDEASPKVHETGNKSYEWVFEQRRSHWPRSATRRWCSSAPTGSSG